MLMRLLIRSRFRPGNYAPSLAPGSANSPQAYPPDKQSAGNMGPDSALHRLGRIFRRRRSAGGARFALTALCLAALGLGGATGCQKTAPDAAEAQKAAYWCPMHPHYTSPRPGDCPICHMKLAPIPADGAARDVPATAGRVMIHLSADKQQLIGLRTSTVFPRPLRRSLRTAGVVEHDETRLTRIAPRFGGWVRELHVNFTGQEVVQGQPLLTVYSPEVLAGQNEYLLARRHWLAVEHSGTVELRETAARLLEAARRRLELWGLDAEEIRALEEREQAPDEVRLRAPVSGHVISRMATVGGAFQAGDTLYEIGALDRLWVRAGIPESDLAYVRTGQVARVTVPALGGRTYETEVEFFYPHVDPRTRRGAARLSLDNADHALRPEMWALVEIEEDFGERLSVPASAVLDTGTRRLVFVRREDDHLEPREIRVGVRTEDWWEVLEGAQEGEKVVTRALFLVDAESQLRAVAAGMGQKMEHEHER